MSDYQGKERRRGPRRLISDRRQDVRWEPDKDDRRQKPGRRASDVDPLSHLGREARDEK